MSADQNVAAAAAPAAGDAAGEAQAEAQQPSFFSTIISLAKNLLLIYMLRQWFSGGAKNDGKSNKSAVVREGGGSSSISSNDGSISDSSNSETNTFVLGGDGPHRNLWSKGTEYNLRVFLSTRTSEVFWMDDFAYLSNYPGSEHQLSNAHRSQQNNDNADPQCANNDNDESSECPSIDQTTNNSSSLLINYDGSLCQSIGQLVWQIDGLEYSDSVSADVVSYFEKSFNLSTPECLYLYDSNTEKTVVSSQLPSKHNKMMRNVDDVYGQIGPLNVTLYAHLLLWKSHFDLEEIADELKDKRQALKDSTMKLSSLQNQRGKGTRAMQAIKQARRRMKEATELPHYSQVVRITHPLTIVKKLRRNKKRSKNLLFGGTDNNNGDINVGSNKNESHPNDTSEMKEKKKTTNDPDWSSMSKDERRKQKRLRRFANFFKPELTIRPVTDWNKFPRGGIPDQIAPHFRFDIETGDYYPTIYMDDFWLLKARYMPVNDTLDTLPLKIIHNPISFWKFTMQAGFEYQQSNKPQWSKMMEARPKKASSSSSSSSSNRNPKDVSSQGDDSEYGSGVYPHYSEDDDDDEDEDDDGSEDEDDMVRKLLLESNPYLLVLTMVVSILHSVFDMLAFKNDITFWKGRKNVEGISVRSMVVNAVFQVVICLYLWEQRATWMVSISSTVGCVIEFWKISQALSIRVILPQFAEMEMININNDAKIHPCPPIEESSDALSSSSSLSNQDETKVETKKKNEDEETSDNNNNNNNSIDISNDSSMMAVPLTMDNYGDYLRLTGYKAGWMGTSLLIGSNKSYTESDTEKFDREAMYYFGYVLYPLLLGYSVYSLMYKEYTGFYQYVLHTCVSFIYMFGFITMLPQLYLNYRMKSTAHLPWRMMTYKFLNTIIDDLFAFMIEMPTLHRLSCFRDDLVFVIFLYQKWLYGTDMTRMNEYGYVPSEHEEKKKEQKEIEESKKDQ